jgi:hypothetical protein
VTDSKRRSKINGQKTHYFVLTVKPTLGTHTVYVCSVMFVGCKTPTNMTEQTELQIAVKVDVDFHTSHTYGGTYGG